MIGALFCGAFWVTCSSAYYAELGDYLIRLGLSWLFLTFLSFLAFSGIVTSLSTFFLSDDLRLLLGGAGRGAPAIPRALRPHAGAGRRGWWSCSSLPVLAGVGLAALRAARPSIVTAVIDVVPFVIIPVALGSAVHALPRQRLPRAARARHADADGPLFATSLVLLLRFIQPERLLRVESLPDVTAFFATLQSPVTPLLPSFWAGETLFASLQGGCDSLHAARALDDGAGAAVVVVRRRVRALALRGLQQGRRKRARRASRAAVRSIALARRAAARRRCGGTARQGPEGVPARRQPVVAAPAAAGARARLPLQLPRARSRAHPVHERRSSRTSTRSSTWRWRDS